MFEVEGFSSYIHNGSCLFRKEDPSEVVYPKKDGFKFYYFLENDSGDIEKISISKLTFLLIIPE